MLLPSSACTKGLNVLSLATSSVVFTVALFTIARKLKQYRCPSTDKYIMKMCTYTMEYYSVVRINEIMYFAVKQTELEDNILSEVTQT